MKCAFVSLALSLGVTACQPQGLGTKKDEASDPDSPEAVEVQTTESGGTVTGTVSAGSQATQTMLVNAGALAGTQVSFPPGSLAIDSNVSVTEGGTLAQAGFLQEVAPEGATVEAEGVAVIVDSDGGADPVGTIAVSVPAPKAASALVQGPNSILVVFFKLFIKSTGQFVSGILPPSQISFDSNAGTVGFSTQYFGQYQAVYVSGLVITEKREVNSTQGAVKKDAGGVDAPAADRPRCTLSTAQKVMSQNPADVSIACNKDITGLSKASFNVSNGTATNLSGAGKSYKLTVTAAAAGQVTVNLKDGAGKGEDGNGTLAETLSYTWQPGTTVVQPPGLPQVAIAAPASGSDVESGAVQTISGTCSPNGATVTVTVDARPCSPPARPEHFPLPTPGRLATAAKP